MQIQPHGRTEAGRTTNGRFAKGTSGNPAGRRRLENADQLYEALKLLAPAAVEYLGKILDDPQASPTVRLQAANAILDRCFGKPVQAVDSRVSVEKESYEDVLRRVLS